MCSSFFTFLRQNGLGSLLRIPAKIQGEEKGKKDARKETPENPLSESRKNVIAHGKSFMRYPPALLLKRPCSPEPATDVPPCRGFRVASRVRKLVRAEIMVVLVGTEHVVNDGEHAMTDSNDGPFRALATSETVVLCREVVVERPGK